MPLTTTTCCRRTIPSCTPITSSGKPTFPGAPTMPMSIPIPRLWSWCFAIPKAAKSPEAAQRFALWATSKEYIRLAAADTGWATVPPGTRKTTYDNPEYLKAAPFASVTLDAMKTADPTDPCLHPVPYQGVQLVGIPEFQSFGTVVGQSIAGALDRKSTR